MKKLIVIALAVVLALSALVVLAACDSEKTYDGEYSYYALNSETNKYGVKVHVTVKGGVIMKVTTDADTETYYNLSTGWTDKQTWIDGEAAFLKSFEGMTVEDLMAIVVPVIEVADPASYKPAGQPDHEKGISNLPEGYTLTAGATQSKGRVILAMQNALKDVK